MTENFRLIEPSLKLLLDRLSIADADYDKAIERVDRYATSLENDREFGVVGTRIGGSIGKRTAIAPLSDVDLYVYLDSDDWQTRRQPLQPGTVIGRLNARLQQQLTFELSNGHATLRKQTHSVGIRFRKSGSVGVDVVPAIVIDGDITQAWIPRRRTEGYIQTSVERQLQILDDLDTPFHFLRRGIKLLKFWNRALAGLPSYAIEILGMHAVVQGCKRTEVGVFLSALDFIARTNMREPVFIEHFYDYQPPRRRACVIFDPAVQNNNVGDGLNAAVGDRLGAIARGSLTNLCKAVDFCGSGDVDIASDLMSEAFGQEGLFGEDL